MDFGGLILRKKGARKAQQRCGLAPDAKPTLTTPSQSYSNTVHKVPGTKVGQDSIHLIITATPALECSTVCNRAHGPDLARQLIL